MFQIKNIIQKKILRLKGSKNILKLNFFFQKYFGEKNIGELGLNFLNKPDRQKIVQDTINRKKYNSYLEIGCFDNGLFNNINCPIAEKIALQGFYIPSGLAITDDQIHIVSDKIKNIFIS